MLYLVCTYGMRHSSLHLQLVLHTGNPYCEIDYEEIAKPVVVCAIRSKQNIRLGTILTLYVYQTLMEKFPWYIRSF